MQPPDGAKAAAEERERSSARTGAVRAEAEAILADLLSREPSHKSPFHSGIRTWEMSWVYLFTMSLAISYGRFLRVL